MAPPSRRVPALLALSVVLSSAVLPVAVGASVRTAGPVCYPRGAGDTPADRSIWHRRLVVEEGSLADVVVTRDGLLLVGETVDRHGSNAGLLVGMGPDGTVRWRRIHDDGGFLAGTVLPGGDYVAVGWQDDGVLDRGGDLWMGRYEAGSGATVWDRRWQMGDPGYPGENLMESGELVDVAVTDSGDVLAVGTGLVNESETRWVSEGRGGIATLLTPNGTERWYREYPEGLGGVAPLPTRRGSVVVERNKHVPVSAWDVRRLDDGGAVVEGWDLTDGTEGHEAEPSAGPRRIRLASIDGVVAVVRPDGTTSWRTVVDGRPTDVVAGPNGSTVVAVRGAGNATELQWYSPSGELVATAPRDPHVRELQRFGETVVLVGSHAGVETVERLPADPPVVRVAATARPGRNDTNVVTLNASRSSARTGVEAYRWDFDGDGAVDERTCEPTVTHRFAQRGVPEVGVTVASAVGIRTTANVTAPVVDTVPPAPALATPENRLVAAGRSARFDASASTDNYGVAEYRWDFDADGAVDAVTGAPGVEHAYRGVDANHTLAVTAVDTSGNAERTTFEVRSVRNDAPAVELAHEAAFANDDTTLTPAVEDRVGTIARVTWHLPDGTVRTLSGPEPIRYRFEEAGTRAVRVTVEDEYGATGTAEAAVVVRTHYPSERGDHGVVVEPLLNWLALLVVVGVPLGRAVAGTVRRDGG